MKTKRDDKRWNLANMRRGNGNKVKRSGLTGRSFWEKGCWKIHVNLASFVWSKMLSWKRGKTNRRAWQAFEEKTENFASLDEQDENWYQYMR